VLALASRGWFACSFLIGTALRSGRYASAEVIERNGTVVVRKERLRRAPILVWLVGVLYKLLDSGVRVLPQHEWEARERERYLSLYNLRVERNGDRVLILPRLPGVPLAQLLSERGVDSHSRSRALALATAALGAMHRTGTTHADAMASNVMIDLDSNSAQWFDFENVHEDGRSPLWCRADDVRALLSSCLALTDASLHAEVTQVIVDSYGDDEIVRLAGRVFDSVLHRPLPFHLGQAPLAYRTYLGIGRALET
jgi:hypothetical protein